MVSRKDEMTDQDRRKKHSEITHAEWICWNWIDTTYFHEDESHYLRGLQRSLDDAMEYAGGSIKDLKPYLWALDIEE